MVGSCESARTGILHVILAWLTRTALFATLSCRLAFTPSLGAFVMGTTARFREYTILLNLAVEALERLLKRIAGVDLDFTHGNYQRDLRSLLRPEFCG
jgi:hypothetical protein